MKRILTLLLLSCLLNISSFAQKKYEMVIQKTDGTEVVINVEDIVKTFFRERNENNNQDNNKPNDSNLDSRFFGIWYERNPNDSFDAGFKFESDGTVTIMNGNIGA